LHQADLLQYVVQVLEERRLAYMVVGSFASATYGEPRLTHDIDIVVRLSLEDVDPLCDAFPEPEFHVSRPAASEAVRRRGQFNVIHPASGNKIDFMIARDDAWGQSQLARRTRQPMLPTLAPFVASPEDVILGKLWYYRDGGSDKHLRDIAGILQLRDIEIDVAYLQHWAQQLGLVEEWQAVLKRMRGRSDREQNAGPSPP
jgi:hypothetical protein